MELVSYIVTAVIAYLLGSIPTGYLVGKSRGLDIRTVGSGNIGATNVFRILGRPAGIFVLLVDALKGFIAAWFVGVLVYRALVGPLQSDSATHEFLKITGGLLAILGHNYTCWLQFKGGKGIATSAGVTLALLPLALAASLAVWLLTFFLTRYVSVASIVAALVLPAAAWWLHPSPRIVFCRRVDWRPGHLQTSHQHPAAPRRDGESFRQKTGGLVVKVAVLGAGSWGTALAKVLHGNGHAVTLWAHRAETLSALASGRHERYLPGVALPQDWHCESELARAVAGQDCVVLAVPSRGFRDVARQLADSRAVLVSVTKGIDYETGHTMCGILRECAPQARVAALSGPTFALEVARGMPTAIVAASEDQPTRAFVQELFHQPKFRVYRSHDLLGVEMGGALKNIIAIAAGVCDGLGFGDNSKAALITRGIAEVRRLGVAQGAEAETFAGLSGLGDLVVTCFSRLSRNRELGERAGCGEKVESLVQPGLKLAEGVPTSRSAHRLASRLQIETPIIDEVHAMLYEGKDVRRALGDLLSRDIKAED